MSDKIDPVPFFDEFQKIIEILEVIKGKINAKTEVVWAGFDNPKEAIEELERDIDKLRSGNYETLAEVNIKFMATGRFQELSMSNGWSDEYLVLAEKFDRIHYKLLKTKNPPDQSGQKKFSFLWRFFFGD